MPLLPLACPFHIQIFIQISEKMLGENVCHIQTKANWNIVLQVATKHWQRIEFNIYGAQGKEYEKSFIIYRLLLCCSLISWTLFDVTSEEHDFHKCQEITSDAYRKNRTVVHRLSRWHVMKGLLRSTSWHLWSLLLWNTNQFLQSHKRFIQSWGRNLISSCPLVAKGTGFIMDLQICSFSVHIRINIAKADIT